MKTFDDCCGNIFLTSVGSVLGFRVMWRDSRLRDCLGGLGGDIGDFGSWEG